jgi:hypothetical protein
MRETTAKNHPNRGKDVELVVYMQQLSFNLQTK